VIVTNGTSGDRDLERALLVCDHRTWRMGSESVQAAEGSDMRRKPLTLIAQLPELPHLGLIHRRPPTEEDRHALVAIAPRVLKLLRVER
jgi:hypothetical protein